MEGSPEGLQFFLCSLYCSFRLILIVAVRRTPLVVLVTGGAGFIGSHVADALLERGDRVAIVDEMNDYYDVRMKQVRRLLTE